MHSTPQSQAARGDEARRSGSRRQGGSSGKRVSGKRSGGHPPPGRQGGKPAPQERQGREPTGTSRSPPPRPAATHDGMPASAGAAVAPRGPGRPRKALQPAANRNAVKTEAEAVPSPLAEAAPPPRDAGRSAAAQHAGPVSNGATKPGSPPPRSGIKRDADSIGGSPASKRSRTRAEAAAPQAEKTPVVWPGRPVRAAAVQASEAILSLSISPAARAGAASPPPAAPAAPVASPPRQPPKGSGHAAAPTPKPQPASPAAVASPRSAAAPPRSATKAGAAGPAYAYVPDDPVSQLAAAVKAALGVAASRACNLKALLRSGALDGEAVEVRTRGGDVLLAGSVAPGGLISCSCSDCRGQLTSSSTFEQHSGSTAHRPAECIYVQSVNMSLKDLAAVVASDTIDIHSDHCALCLDGGDLVCCDGCPRVFHPHCVGLAGAPEGDWFCADCAAASVAQRKPKPKAKPKPSAAALSTPQRVRMLAPSAGPGRQGKHRHGNVRGNGSRNRLLFTREPGALQDGMRLAYVIHGEVLLEGTAKIGATDADPSGILCDCCKRIISCSSFEAHAGYAARRAPYDNIYTVEGITLRTVADMMPAHAGEGGPGGAAGAGGAKGGEHGALEVVADRCREVIGELDTLPGGCVLCHSSDFQQGGFGPRTIIICDQCEREFHVGCLKQYGRADLHELPEGDWHCSAECLGIATALAEAVANGPMPLPGSGEHTWQLLHGRDGTHQTTWSLKAVHETLQESFDPIMDVLSDTDLMPFMIYCQMFKEFDYSGCYTMLLRQGGRPVAAALMRVFGPQLAELPLIATRLSARRQGHCRVLLRAFEDLLRSAGVQCLLLPAAHETVGTWMHGFGFTAMPEEQLQVIRSELRPLIFPGTTVLCKQLLPGASGGGGAPAAAPAATGGAAGPSEAAAPEPAGPPHDAPGAAHTTAKHGVGPATPSASSDDSGAGVEPPPPPEPMEAGAGGGGGGARAGEATSGGRGGGSCRRAGRDRSPLSKRVSPRRAGVASPGRAR